MSKTPVEMEVLARFRAAAAAAETFQAELSAMITWAEGTGLPLSPIVKGIAADLDEMLTEQLARAIGETMLAIEY